MRSVKMPFQHIGGQYILPSLNLPAVQNVPPRLCRLGRATWNDNRRSSTSESYMTRLPSMESPPTREATDEAQLDHQPPFHSGDHDRLPGSSTGSTPAFRPLSPPPPPRSPLSVAVTVMEVDVTDLVVEKTLVPPSDILLEQLKAAAVQELAAWKASLPGTRPDYRKLGRKLEDGIECLICGCRLTSDFPRHCKKHNKDNCSYPCPVTGCAYRNTQASNLQTHLRTKHPMQANVPKLPCWYRKLGCDKQYADPAALARHMKAKHGDYNPQRRTFLEQKRGITKKSHHRG